MNNNILRYLQRSAMIFVMVFTMLQSAFAANGYGLPKTIQEGVILHCFDWKYSHITANLQNIAEAGFVAVQTSPAQANYDGTTSWNTLYRPRDTEIGPNTLGTKAELATLCSEAAKYGIKVIVDVVANHTDGSLQWVANFWKDTSLYHTHGGVSNWHDRWQVINGEIGMKDLKTEDSRVQQKFKAYIQALKAIGVAGCRFDAAKHIGLPSEGDNFWPAVIDRDMFNYGEILDNTGGDDSKLIPEYLQYMSITDSPYGTNNVLGSAKNGQATSHGGGNYSFSYKTDKLVYWGESHDTYCNSGGMSDGVSQEVVDRAYAVAASHNNIPALYFSRPVGTNGPSAQAGTMGSTHYTSKSVAEVNKFHNAMAGKESYYTGGGSVASISRKGGGAIVVNFHGAGNVSIANGGGYAKPGTYTDRVSGNTFIITSSTISGNTNSTGIAVLYEDVNPAPVVTFSTKGSTFKTETLSLTATLSNAANGWYQVGTSAKVNFTGSTTFAIGAGVEYGTAITVKWGATGADGSEVTGSETYTKADPNAKVYVYYNNPNNWSNVSCYLYKDNTNNAWPGTAMTYGANITINGKTGWWYMEVADAYTTGQAIVTNGVQNGTQQYPGQNQPGVQLNGNSVYIDGTAVGETTVKPDEIIEPVKIPTVSIDKTSGEFTGSVAVTLTASETDAAIVYTTNGIAPTANSEKAVGSKTLTFTSTTTLMAGVLYGGEVKNVVSATYTKATPNGKVYVYYNNPNKWNKVNCYLYKDNTNNAWPGTAMTYGANITINGKTGWWYLEVSDAYTSGNAMVTNGVASGTQQYPSAGQAGIKLDGKSIYIDGTATGTTAVVPTIIPTVSIDKSSADFIGSISVNLTASSSDATVVYTTNGVAPTTESEKITGGKTFAFTETTTLMAGVLYDGEVKNVVSATYTRKQQPKEGITIYVKAEKTPYLYAWVDEQTKLNGNWPGKLMSDKIVINNDTYYYQSFTQSSINIIFNNGSGAQTKNIEGITSTSYYTYDGSTGYQNIPAPVVEEEEEEEVIEDAVEIKMSGEYTSFASTKNLLFNDSELKAFIVAGYRQSSSGITMVLLQVDYVPAGTGLILKGTPGSIYKIGVAEFEAGYSNFLKGVTEQTTISSTDGEMTNYAFVKDNGQYRFAKVASTRTLPAGKAYLQLPKNVAAVANAKGISYTFDDETTGIDDINENIENDDAYYTLTGVKTYKPSNGIYIHKGKKVLFK